MNTILSEIVEGDRPCVRVYCGCPAGIGHRQEHVEMNDWSQLPTSAIEASDNDTK